jgi:hypothetical protein
MEDKQTIFVEGQSVSYIKLIKNTKGYNWEIKILSLDLNELRKINDDMLINYGGTD